MSKHGDAIIRLTAALAEKEKELAELRGKAKRFVEIVHLFGLEREMTNEEIDAFDALRAAVGKGES